MAAYWGNSLAKTFSFFTSYTPKTVFDPKKSLYNNFVNMCSIGFFQPNSNETNGLIAAFRKHDASLMYKPTCYPSLEIEQFHLEQQYISLTEVIGKLSAWVASRNGSSSRLKEVQSFRSQVEIYQTSIDVKLKEIKSKLDEEKRPTFFKLVDEKISDLNKKNSPSLAVQKCR